MKLRSAYRILNGIVWFWLWLSAAMDFVPDPDPNHVDRFRALFQLSNSFHEAYATSKDAGEIVGDIAGRAIVFLLLWFLIDSFLRRRSKSKGSTP